MSPKEFFKAVMAVVLSALVMVGVSRCCAAILKAPTYAYKAEEVPAQVVMFHPGNVREEPVAIDPRLYPDNVLGGIGEDGFTLYLPSGKVYRVIDQGNAANGYYYGFLVDDIVSTPEGRRWFPSEEILKNDADGIVWVNEGYAERLF